MKRLIIKKNRIYVRATTPGISGFKQWDKLEIRLVPAETARCNRLEIVAAFNPWAISRSRHICKMLSVEDGRAQEDQMQVTMENADAVIGRNPGYSLYIGTIEKKDLREYLCDPAFNEIFKTLE